MKVLAVVSDSGVADQLLRSMGVHDPDGWHAADTDPVSALRHVECIKPDFVLLDTDVLAKSDSDLIGKIRQLSPETIIFVRGWHKEAGYETSIEKRTYIIMPLDEIGTANGLGNMTMPDVPADRQKLLRVQCFGNFEVFEGDGIIRFARSLSKEAFAYLIDRRGAGCTVSEICSILWEDRSADKNLKSQCRVIMASLKKDLEAAGAGDVIVKARNSWSIDTSKVNCDYYKYIRGDRTAVNLFRGEYMSQYSWAEMTAGRLFEI